MSYLIRLIDDDVGFDTRVSHLGIEDLLVETVFSEIRVELSGQYNSHQWDCRLVSLMI